MTQVKQLQGTLVATANLLAHAAATASEIWPIFTAPGAVAIVSVVLVPQADVSGANTNTTHLNLQNRGVDGTGTTELASYDLTSGNDLVDFDEYELYAPATALAIADGVVLAIQHEKVGNGLAVPMCLAVIEYRAQG